MLSPTPLEDRISYRFRNHRLLNQALTHRSYHQEHRGDDAEDNEQLEFLGDSVIELAVSHLLLSRFPQLSEGGLSKFRATLVRQATLASLARTIELDTQLRLGCGEEVTEGRKKDSILAGALEALAAAIYLDGGYDEAFRVIEHLIAPLVEKAERRLDHEDFKTRLQEYTQRNLNTLPDYVVTREEGPDHDKTFQVVISIQGRICGKGAGKSKKEAGEKAAAQALKYLTEPGT